jgi:hypothetical protein
MAMIETEDRIDPATGEILNPHDQVASFGKNLELSEEDVDLLNKYAGAGYSHETEDGLTPVLSILQDNSGEVKKNHERRIEAAESGMLIIRSMRRLYPGGEGLLIQPFGFNHTLIEWSGEPGEGIPVSRFPFHEAPEDAYEAPHPQDPNRKVLRRRSSGNRLVDTREHYGNILDGIDPPFPVVIPMSGSNHSASRLWTNMMRNMIYQGKKIPSFFRTYRLKTIFRKRGANLSWYGYSVDPSGFVRDRQLLQLGAECYESLKEKPLETNMEDMREIDDSTVVAHASTVNPNDVI